MTKSDPVEALEAALEVIDAVDGEVGAFTFVDRDGSRRAAEASARRHAEGTPLGPLDGVLVGVKEIYAVRGWPHTGGSLTRAGVIASEDAALVARLRTAGAVLVGLTRSHELAWGITTRHAVLGGTANPWDTTRIAGGSSGGSAAAIAAGMVPLALGSDTAGSIRIPAAFCGVVGFKPTWSLLPVEGLLPLAPTFDHAGFLGAEVDLVATATGVQPATWTAGGLVGIAEGVPDHVAALFASGAVPIQLPDGRAAVEAFALVQRGEAAEVHTRVLGTWPSRRNDYGPDVRARLEGAVRGTVAQLTQGHTRRAAIAAALDALLDATPLVVAPVAACGPSTVDDPDNAVGRDGRRAPLRELVLPHTVPANLAGLPACSVPVGLDDEGLPIGVQVIGRRGDDAAVLGLAAWLRGTCRDQMPSSPPIGAAKVVAVPKKPGSADP